MKKGIIKEIIEAVLWVALCIGIWYIGLNYDLVPEKQAAPAPAASQAQEKAPGEPEIIGPPEFQTEVKEAIAVIKEKAPNHYKCLCSLVEKIELSDNPPNDYFAWTAPENPVIYFSTKAYSEHMRQKNNISRIGKHFVYMVLVHETAHRIQFKYYQITDTQESEAQALAAEKDLLKKLGVPQGTINQLSGGHVLQEK